MILLLVGASLNARAEDFPPVKCESQFLNESFTLDSIPVPQPGYQDAVVVVLRSGHRILFAKRGRETTGSLNWSFVGGKMDADENILESASRETYEEVRVRLKNPELLGVSRSKDQGKAYRVFVVLAEFEGDLQIPSEERGKLEQLQFFHFSEQPYPLFEATSYYYSWLLPRLHSWFRVHRLKIPLF